MMMVTKRNITINKSDRITVRYKDGKVSYIPVNEILMIDRKNKILTIGTEEINLDLIEQVRNIEGDLYNYSLEKAKKVVWDNYIKHKEEMKKEPKKKTLYQKIFGGK